MGGTLIQKRKECFVFWRSNSEPRLVIGQFKPGNPNSLIGKQCLPMARTAPFDDLWEIEASACNLVDGHVYHYWFEIDDKNSTSVPKRRTLVSDPCATTADWRLIAAAVTGVSSDQAAASVIRFRNRRLEACDSEDPDVSGSIDFSDAGKIDELPANNRLVIYELPTAWTGSVTENNKERAVGTFRDVHALVEKGVGGANFSHLAVSQPNATYLKDLGINALELLPPADSVYKREWGYGTTNFFAPDHELGFPEGHSFPTPNGDLAELIRGCHRNNIRFFVDMVLAFAKDGPYEQAHFNDFHIGAPGSCNGMPEADACTSGRRDGSRGPRNGFGSALFRYAGPVRSGYDPVSGNLAHTVSARQWMKSYLERWMKDFHVDGIRLDSIENVANWDFIQEFKDLARRLYKERWQAANPGVVTNGDDRFLVVGEELTVPTELLVQKRLDGLWNEDFKRLIRSALIGTHNGEHGKDASGNPSFEWTVRKAIDCRHMGFADGAQAINYLTSHDVEGMGNERLFNYFQNCSIYDKEKRFKLAFACLLTAVGIPMILAGDEFADQHDLTNSQGWVTHSDGKQVDPVNFSRQGDEWRRRIFAYVSRLIHLRTSSNALAVNDVDFIHVDFNDGKRVMVWQRGMKGSDDIVVVVANFSEFSTDMSHPNANYVVPNWPATPFGRSWREVTQDRPVPSEWIGREPIFAWEAKVYTTC
ncbi:MAG: alpha amylase [Magnetococcales bacterium]|nr:alpha amylase [Magnetococcales bacterium]